MNIKFENGSWLPAPIGGIPFEFNASVDLESVPAPPAIDARLMKMVFKDGLFYATYEERETTDDLIMSTRMRQYQFVGKSWKRL